MSQVSKTYKFMYYLLQSWLFKNTQNYNVNMYWGSQVCVHLRFRCVRYPGGPSWTVESQHHVLWCEQWSLKLYCWVDTVYGICTPGFVAVIDHHKDTWESVPCVMVWAVVLETVLWGGHSVWYMYSRLCGCNWPSQRHMRVSTMCYGVSSGPWNCIVGWTQCMVYVLRLCGCNWPSQRHMRVSTMCYGVSSSPWNCIVGWTQCMVYCKTGNDCVILIIVF